MAECFGDAKWKGIIKTISDGLRWDWSCGWHNNVPNQPKQSNNAGVIVLLCLATLWYLATLAKFMEIAGIPGVIGDIDGRHIKIIAPSQDEDVFVNRKQLHSINIQIVFDARYNILDSQCVYMLILVGLQPQFDYAAQSDNCNCPSTHAGEKI